MKVKKRLFPILLLLLLTVLTLASCGEKAPKMTINVYNWGEYISDGSYGELDSNKAFEEYFNTEIQSDGRTLAEKYGFEIEVSYSTYATNEDMYSKLTSGAGSYDVVVPSDYMIEQMINANMLLPLDFGIIKNYSYISEDFKGESVYYDPDNLYSVPYTYGMTGIIYNTALVDEEDIDGSWSLLWNEKYKGKILQFNNPRDAFGSAMYLLGINVNSTSDADWQTALAKLSEQKPLIQAYVNDEIYNKMTTASAAIAPYFAGDYVTMAEQNEDLAFYYPKEGVNYFVDAFCIPKSSKHPDVACEYINFMLSEEPAVANAKYIGYASPNELVKNNADYIDYMGEDAMAILYDTPPSVVNESYNKSFGTACYRSLEVLGIQDKVNTLWESLKTENATELWIHVTCIVIVGGVLALGIYTVYIRKKRSRHYRLRDREQKAVKSK